MRNNARRKIAAFSMPELLVVVAVIGVLAAVLLPDLARKKSIANRVKCVGNHKLNGTSFRVFAADNGDLYPLTAVPTRTNAFIVPSGATGSQVNSSSAVAWQVYQVMWNELQTPKTLLCPTDRERATCYRTTDFGGLAGAPGIMTTTSLGHSGNQDNAVSYALGVAADESRPLGVLLFDRNVNNVGLAGASVASNVALTRTRAVMNHKLGPTQAVYVKGTRMHGLAGNLAYADGSVQQATAEVLRQSFENAAKVYNTVTNQNEVLFP